MQDVSLIEEEVSRIASQLIQEAKSNEHGLYWLTYNRLSEGDPFLQLDESIFTGTTGIVLFFVALYQYTGDASYLQTAVEGTRWCVQYAKEADKRYVSFYSGHTGVVYLCCKMYEITQDPAYLAKALQLVNELTPWLQEGNNISDFTSGDAGNLFVLTYVHALTGEQDILTLIQTGLDRLIDAALISRQGLKWGYIPNSLDSLCGLSHGASGIGYVLLELGHYFQNKALVWLAEQAFLYEAQYFRKSLHNWLDLRVYTDHLTHTQTLQKKKASLLVKGGDVNAWAHGTAGIGLIRLRAVEILGNQTYKKEAQSAVTKTLRDLSRWDRPSDFSLSSGLGGLSELLVAASTTFAAPALLTQARKLAFDAITLRKKIGYFPSVWGQGRECPSLLLGKAGIGYSFLRVLNSGKVDSILLPRLPSPACMIPLSASQPKSYWWHATLAQIRRNIWGKPFRRTLSLLTLLDNFKASSLFDLKAHPSETKELLVLQKKIRTWVQTLPKAEKLVVAEILRLENRRIALLTSYQGVIYREVRRKTMQEQANLLQDRPMHEFLHLSFKTGAHIEVLANQWNWASDQPENWQINLVKPAKAYPVMLVNTTCFVEEYAISPFATLLLKALRRKIRVDQLIEKMSAYFPGQAQQVKETLTPKIIAQLKQFSLEGLIELTD
jgi:hypothetical protein